MSSSLAYVAPHSGGADAAVSSSLRICDSAAWRGLLRSPAALLGSLVGALRHINFASAIFSFVASQCCLSALCRAIAAAFKSPFSRTQCRLHTLRRAKPCPPAHRQHFLATNLSLRGPDGAFQSQPLPVPLYLRGSTRHVSIVCVAFHFVREWQACSYTTARDWACPKTLRNAYPPTEHVCSPERSLVFISRLRGPGATSAVNLWVTWRATP